MSEQPIAVQAAAPLSTGVNTLPDLAVGDILQRSFAGMDAGLVAWLDLSLVCR